MRVVYPNTYREVAAAVAFEAELGPFPLIKHLPLAHEPSSRKAQTSITAIYHR